jgi:hypothetical protein
MKTRQHKIRQDKIRLDNRIKLKLEGMTAKLKTERRGQSFCKESTQDRARYYEDKRQRRRTKTKGVTQDHNDKMTRSQRQDTKTK